MVTLYTDIWELIATYLSPDELYNFSITCKSANKACRRATIQKIISYPLNYPYKLTSEQRNVIINMEKFKLGFKLINGDVGSGKTITSIAYACRNYMENPESKIVMCGPPNLVKMWKDTLIKFFGIVPVVFHNSNPKYSLEYYKNIPEEKFLIFSYFPCIDLI